MGFGVINEQSTGYPGYNSVMSREAARPRPPTTNRSSSPTKSPADGITDIGRRFQVSRADLVLHGKLGRIRVFG